MTTVPVARPTDPQPLSKSPASSPCSQQPATRPSPAQDLLIYLKSILVLPYHLRLGPTSGLLPSGFPSHLPSPHGQPISSRSPSSFLSSSSSSVGATTLGGFWPALRFCSTIFYLYTSLSSFSLSSSLDPLLLGQTISVLVFLLVLMNMVPIQWVFLTVLVVSSRITCATQRNLCDYINLTIFFFLISIQFPITPSQSQTFYFAAPSCRKS